MLEHSLLATKFHATTCQCGCQSGYLQDRFRHWQAFYLLLYSAMWECSGMMLGLYRVARMCASPASVSLFCCRPYTTVFSRLYVCQFSYLLILCRESCFPNRRHNIPTEGQPVPGRTGRVRVEGRSQEDQRSTNAIHCRDPYL